MVMAAVAMSMEEMHERACKNEDERCVGEDVLPVPDESTDHHDGEDVVEPVGNTEVFHEWGWE